MDDLYTYKHIKEINLKNFMEFCDKPKLISINRSILLKGNSDHRWCYIVLDNEGDITALIHYLDKSDKYFVIQDEYVESYFEKAFSMEWILKCQKYAYCSNRIFDNIENDSEIQKLSIEDAKYIYRFSDYKAYTDIGYIENCIKKGLAIGIKKDGKLIAWLLTHDDGALGFLNVVEQYRKMGYAKRLVKKAVNLLEEENKLPFAHIEKANYKSLNLIIGLGFTYVGDITWIKIQ